MEWDSKGYDGIRNDCIERVMFLGLSQEGVLLI
jgi:hypothetical protein